VRITEFLIARYGHIENERPSKPSDFTLFWGMNERGKTLTIDALVKLLLGKEARLFVRMDRIDEQPSGYAVVEIDGQQYKLPEKGALTGLCNLSGSECRNVFIIRASDLSIEKEHKSTDTEKEADFYAEVTDRFTGMKTRRISDVREALFYLARITPTGKFRDVKDEGLKGRFEAAVSLASEIVRLSDEIESSGLDTMERQAVDTAETIDRLENELSVLDDARKRKRYETGFAAVERLEEAVRQTDELAQYRDDDEQAWRDAEREASRIAADIASLRAQLEKKQAELEKRTAELRTKERDFQIIRSRKQKIDEDVRPRLVSYEKRLGRNAENTQKKGLYTLLSAISAAVLCASLVGIIIRPQILFTGLAVTSFLVTGVCVALLAWTTAGRARIERDFQEVKIDLARLELTGKTVQETLANLQKFNELYEKRLDEINDLKQDRAVLEREIRSIISEEIPQQEQTASTTGYTIIDIQRRCGCRTVKELGEKIAERRRAESAVSEQIAILSGRFGKGTGNPAEDITPWRQKVAEFSPYRGKAVGVEFTEFAYQEKQEARKAAQQVFAEVSSRLADFKKRLEYIKQQAEIILAPKDDVIFCDTSIDLSSIAEKLSAFVGKHQSDRDAAMIAATIFEEIGTEERQQVSQFFGEESPVSGYFSSITGGLYDAVSFDHKDKIIRIRKRSGEYLTPDKLSSGAYDQLYLAIRLALGRRIAPDGAGFFIMDAPFIRSDPDRLAVQMKMLADIVREGWQVLYFSSKGEVREVLDKEIKKGAVTLIDI